MSPTPVVLSILIAASTALAADLRFVPPNPTSRTTVTAHITMKSGCPPVTGRIGNFIGITFTPCATVATESSDFAIDLGILPAGVYKVSVDFGSTDGTPVAGFGIADAMLSVQDAAPPFFIVPNVASAGDQVTILANGKDLEACASGPSPIVCSTYVQFGTTPAPIVSAAHEEVVVVVPPHDPGVVDVSVVGNRAAAAFVYLGSGDHDPAFFEPILIPVAYNGPGVLGSRWQTELSLRNDNDFPLTAENPLFTILCDVCNGRLAAHTTLTNRTANISGGWVMFVPRQAAPNVHFGILIKDLSQQSKALGTEVPVVREKDFFDHTLELLNVPTDPLFRVALRVYDLGTPLGLRVQIFTMDGNDPLISTFVFPAGRNSSLAMISDLVAQYPQLAGKGPLRIAIDPPQSGIATTWAFASVTNNETQHVTTISPQ